MSPKIPSSIRGPLLYDEVNREPYLALPYPHENIRLTPPRLSDVESIVSILNDRRVYASLQGPPFPYKSDHAVSWITLVKKTCDDVVVQLEAAPRPSEHQEGAGEDVFIVGGCPVRILRERKEDGSDMYLGDLGIDRHGFPLVVDEEEKARKTRENEAKSIGDPTIIWSFGDYLASSHHGRGIMTAAVRMLMEKWAIPHMNVRRIRAEVFTGNIASQRVFEKNGFKYLESLPDAVDLRFKDCGVMGLTSLEWSKSDSQ